MSFEWRTDEDKGWQEPIKPEETAVSQSFLRRRWRFLLTALLGVAAVWGVVQWQINQRVTTATVEVESELLNTHNFVLQTAVDQDEDLFKSNLSGRDPAWGEVQKSLLSEDLLLNRPMLGWDHVPVPTPLTVEDVTITLDPTFNAAELLYPQTYAVQVPSGEMEMVTLQQTAVYRLGERRWLYSPPPDDFWGDWITQGGDYLTVAYPERDREVAARLAIHLDQLVGQMCAELDDLNCDSDLRFHLRLDTDPESLLEINEIETMLTAGLRLELPTPTLVGLPTDDASYEVLYQAYGVQLATAVLAHQIEYDCCRHQLFFRALRDYQLAQLDLQAWPLNEAMFSQMLTAGFDGDILRHWTRRWEEAPPQFLQVWVVEEPDPIWQEVYMLIEFLNEQETAVSPTEMMRLMNRNNYDNWLADVLGSSYDESLFETRFLEYIYAQASSGQQAELPIPLPAGTINLICEALNNNGPGSRIWAFDLATGTWTERFIGQFRNAYVSSTDGEHFVVTKYGVVTKNGDGSRYNTFKFSLVTEDSVQLLEEAEIAAQTVHSINYFFIEQANEYLMRHEYEEGELSISLLKTNCASGDCPEIQIDGWPLFSPDRQHLLVRIAPDQARLTESDIPPELQNDYYVMSLDEQVQQPVGRGGAAFWLTEDTYGMVIMRGNGWALLTAVLSRNLPRFLFGEADLLTEIPVEERPDDLLVNQIVANPTRPQELLLQARQMQGIEDFDPQTPSYLFKIILTPDLAEVEQIEFLQMDSFSGAIGLSPDGRFIIIRDDYSDPGVTWYLLDQETGQTSDPIITQGYSFVWSPDGQWFIQDTENYLLLTAPAYAYQHFIPHGFGSCPQVILSTNDEN